MKKSPKDEMDYEIADVYRNGVCWNCCYVTTYNGDSNDKEFARDAN
jgi:hypothetical protein